MPRVDGRGASTREGGGSFKVTSPAPHSDDAMPPAHVNNHVRSTPAAQQKPLCTRVFHLWPTCKRNANSPHEIMSRYAIDNAPDEPPIRLHAHTPPLVQRHGAPTRARARPCRCPVYFCCFFTGRFQPLRVCCGVRLKVSSPAGASLLMVEPAPMVAPAPTVTGAINCVSEPMKTSSSMTV